MEQIALGTFEVESTRPLVVPCVESLDYFGVRGKTPVKHEFTAPGCLLKVKRITAAEPGFSNKQSYDVYYEKDDCSNQTGKKLALHLLGQCCSEFPVTCDRDPSKNKTKTAAFGDELSCAAPHAGHWNIIEPDSYLEIYADKLRKKYKESHIKKWKRRFKNGPLRAR
jgi:hypothetical protein